MTRSGDARGNGNHGNLKREGKPMKRVVPIWLAATMLALSGCATVTIKPVDFSWSFESVLTADSAGIVKGEPKTIAFDAGALFRAESDEKETAAGRTVRVIRDPEGFTTSPPPASGTSTSSAARPAS